MKDTCAVGLLVLTVAIAGCTSKPAEDAEHEALRQRVAALEQEQGDQEVLEEGVPGAGEVPAGEREPAPATPSRRERVRPVSRSTGSSAAAVEPLPTPAPPDARYAHLPVEVADAARIPLRPPLRVPAGATLELVLETPLSSRDSQLDDRVVARVQRITDAQGADLLPGGSSLEGRVTEVERSGKVKGRARVSVGFHTIFVRGRRYGLSATSLAVEAEGSQKRDAEVLGGGAIAGAVIGAIAGGRKGAVKGAAVGVGAGGAVVLLTRGKEIELPSGTALDVVLGSDLLIEAAPD